VFVRYDETPTVDSSSIKNLDLRIVGDFSKSMLTTDMPMLEGSSQFGTSRAAFANRTIVSIFDAVQVANQQNSGDQKCRVYGYRFSNDVQSMGRLNEITKQSVYKESPDGATNLQAAIELVLKDGNAAIASDPSRKQVIIVLTDGTPTNSAGKSDTPENQVVLPLLLKTFYEQAKKQKSDEDLTIAFIQCTSNASKFKEYCESQEFWEEKGDTGGIYRDILEATNFLNIADDRLAALFPDIPFDIIDCISADDMLDANGNLKPIASLIAKMIND
jgi:von Willebrand factor type A domain